MPKELTGRHVFAITASAFTIIIAVNVTMAVNAVQTFPGLEVKNSYVASQQFQSLREAREDLGWHVSPSYAGGELRLAFTDAAGQPVVVQNLQVLVGRTTVSQDDVHPEFQAEGGSFVAPLSLGRGKWMLQVQAEAEDGTPYGLQWTLFRSALAAGDATDASQFWMGHAAVTTPDAHFAAERFARGGTGQAGVTAAPFEAWIDEWQMASKTR